MKKRLLSIAMLCLVLMFAVVPVVSATTPAIGFDEKKTIWYTDGVVSYEFTAPESKLYTFSLGKLLPVQMTQTLNVYDDQNQLLGNSVSYGIAKIYLNLTAGQVVRIDASTTFKAGLVVY
ncbi:hypothetical protein K0T92_12415 [Paenibacillus oenotherae]|uniref:Uncharacterized protein n=1 Tax=Paenibacillus oenotherae TaxID=1435645 RepID=A0ABS7D6U3_9BACL|nr:hypothetical protein [Paenibacillus oenotherae]MBW7475556.1 hypothetical protein [Paenibacillus oenotherae]